MNIKDIVKDQNPANFSYYRHQHCYYTVLVDGVEYIFPVDLEDIADATLNDTMKAITLMRYIRLALDAGTFIKTGH